MLSVTRYFIVGIALWSLLCVLLKLEEAVPKLCDAIFQLVLQLQQLFIITICLKSYFNIG